MYSWKRKNCNSKGRRYLSSIFWFKKTKSQKKILIAQIAFIFLTYISPRSFLFFLLHFPPFFIPILIILPTTLTDICTLYPRKTRAQKLNKNLVERTNMSILFLHFQAEQGLSIRQSNNVLIITKRKYILQYVRTVHQNLLTNRYRYLGPVVYPRTKSSGVSRGQQQLTSGCRGDGWQGCSPECGTAPRSYGDSACSTPAPDSRTSSSRSPTAWPPGATGCWTWRGSDRPASGPAWIACRGRRLRCRWRACGWWGCPGRPCACKAQPLQQQMNDWEQGARRRQRTSLQSVQKFTFW